MSLLVTAAQSGTGVSDGLALTVKVITGAAPSPKGATAESGSVTTPELAITPQGTGSWVYGALTNGGATGTFTAASGTTLTQNVYWAGDGITFATLRSTGTTTASTPVTLGASAPTGAAGQFSIALLEILAAGTLAEDSSSPAVVYTETTTEVSTSTFTPPAGSLLVAMVSSDCSGTTGQAMTIGVSDSSGLTWVQQVTADYTTGTASFQTATVWTAEVPSAPFTASAVSRLSTVTRASATRARYAQAAVPVVASAAAAGAIRRGVTETAEITAGAAQAHSVQASLLAAAQVTAGAQAIRIAGAAEVISAATATADHTRAALETAVVIAAGATVIADDAVVYGAADKVSKAGDTMTGPLTVEAPVVSTEAVTSGAAVIPWAPVITPDAQLAGHFRVTLAGATTIEAPTCPADGQKITLELIQDPAGGHSVTFGAGFSFGSAGAPNLATRAGALAVAGFVYSEPAAEWMFAGIVQGFVTGPASMNLTAGAAVVAVKAAAAALVVPPGTEPASAAETAAVTTDTAVAVTVPAGAAPMIAAAVSAAAAVTAPGVTFPAVPGGAIPGRSRPGTPR